MTDLHERIAAKVAERRALAEPGAEWFTTPMGGLNAPAGLTAITDGGIGVIGSALHPLNAALMAANDPADTLRRCDHADKVLARHGNEYGSCGWDEEEWPCPDILDMAEAWDVQP